MAMTSPTWKQTTSPWKGPPTLGRNPYRPVQTIRRQPLAQPQNLETPAKGILRQRLGTQRLGAVCSLGILVSPHPAIDVRRRSDGGYRYAKCPAGVTITNDAAHQALASLFTDRLIMTDLRLGALMEYSEQEVPTVTIECGGAQDDHAHQLAYEGLVRYASQSDVLSLEKAEWNVAVLRNPIRVELAPDATIEYRLTPSGQADLTFPPDIEHRNFGIVSPDEPLGWVGQKGLDVLTAISHNRAENMEQVLRIKDGRIYPAQAIKTFMITTNPVIAKSDCLFYAVKATGDPIF